MVVLTIFMSSALVGSLGRAEPRWRRLGEFPGFTPTARVRGSARAHPKQVRGLWPVRAVGRVVMTLPASDSAPALSAL